MKEVRPVISNDELARETTKTLGRQIEPFVLLVQGLGVVVSANIDKFTLEQRIFMYCFASVHVALFFRVRRTPGPLTRGGIWLALWIGAILIMPIVVAVFNPPEYGKYESCTHLCSYSWPAMAVVALYPWLTVGRMIRVRMIRAVAILATVIVEPLLITGYIEHWQLRANNYWSVITTAIWSICGFITGIAIGYMCRTAASSQRRLAQEAYSRLFNFLHSHVDGAILVIDSKAYSPKEVRHQMHELRKIISQQRIELLATQDPAPVSDLFREATRFYDKALRITTPRLAYVSIPQRLVLILDRAIGDLLKNVLEHCGPGTQVELKFSINGRIATLDVIDSGGGLPDTILDDPANPIHGLRRDIRRIGGNLKHVSNNQHGAHLRLTLPTA